MWQYCIDVLHCLFFQLLLRGCLSSVFANLLVMALYQMNNIVKSVSLHDVFVVQCYIANKSYTTVLYIGYLIIEYN